MYIFFIALVMVSPVLAGAGWLVYEEGTAVKSINGEAPVVATSRVYIAAGPQTVWHVMTDFNRWPEWNEDVSWASFEGEVEPGAQFIRSSPRRNPGRAS